MSNEIQTIVKWFSDAKPNPTIEDACVQIGCLHALNKEI